MLEMLGLWDICIGKLKVLIRVSLREKIFVFRVIELKRLSGVIFDYWSLDYIILSFRCKIWSFL